MTSASHIFFRGEFVNCCPSTPDRYRALTLPALIFSEPDRYRALTLPALIFSKPDRYRALTLPALIFSKPTIIALPQAAKRSVGRLIGVAALMDREQTVYAKYHLCGLEQMPAMIAGAVVFGAVTFGIRRPESPSCRAEGQCDLRQKLWSRGLPCGI